MSPAVLSCAAGPTSQAVVQNGMLLVKTDVGEGFRCDYEVPVDRDLGTPSMGREALAA